MYFPTVLAITSTLASTTLAIRTYTLIFNGAAGTGFSMVYNLYDTHHALKQDLSISSITSYDFDVGKSCAFAVDKKLAQLVKTGKDTWSISPPGRVTDYSCTRRRSKRTAKTAETVHVEFQGADPSEGAKYGLDIPLDGSVVTTSKWLVF